MPNEAEAQAREILARLAAVMDPELDESVVELGFVSEVEVSPGGAALIRFRLPTYWCAANFAFLMAEDLRRAAGTVPGVTRVEVCLADHMYADAINAGIREGRSFQATFGDEADGEDLGTLRRRFRTKAFLRRQDVLLRHLLDCGWPAPAIAALSREALAALPLDAALVRARDRYLEIRDEIAGPGTLAFVTDEGAALDPDRLAQHLAMLRRVTANMVFNGALCRGLLRARYGERPGGEPTLYDFAALRP